MNSDMRILVRVAGVLFVSCWLAQQGYAIADTSAYKNTRPSADGIGKSYMGREIASVMGWQAAGWLEEQ